MNNNGAMLLYFGGLLLGALAVVLLIIGGLIAVATGHTKVGLISVVAGLAMAIAAAKITGFL